MCFILSTYKYTLVKKFIMKKEQHNAHKQVYILGRPIKGLNVTSIVALSTFSSRNLTSVGPFTEHTTAESPKLYKQSIIIL